MIYFRRAAGGCRASGPGLFRAANSLQALMRISQFAKFDNVFAVVRGARSRAGSAQACVAVAGVSGDFAKEMAMQEIRVQKVKEPQERKLPIFRDVEKLMARIRERAFELFAGRGQGHGHALDDWLAAEREICWAASELAEDDKEYVMEVALAGFEPAEISVSATPRELIVHAATKAEHAEKGKVAWSHFSSNDVYRRVELETEINVDKVTARFKNGLLKIVAPKVAQPKHEITVSSAA
jgi:HSP20 family protein